MAVPPSQKKKKKKADLHDSWGSHFHVDKSGKITCLLNDKMYRVYLSTWKWNVQLHNLLAERDTELYWADWTVLVEEYK